MTGLAVSIIAVLAVVAVNCEKLMASMCTVRKYLGMWGLQCNGIGMLCTHLNCFHCLAAHGCWGANLIFQYFDPMSWLYWQLKHFPLRKQIRSGSIGWKPYMFFLSCLYRCFPEYTHIVTLYLKELELLCFLPNLGNRHTFWKSLHCAYGL